MMEEGSGDLCGASTACCFKELLLHRAVGQDAILQSVRLLIAVAVTGGQMATAGIVVGIKTGTGVALGIVMSNAAGVGVRFVRIAGETHLEAVAIAGFAVVVAVVVGLAIARGHGSARAGVVIAVIGIIVSQTISDFVAGARSEFDVDAIGISAAAVGVVFALAVVDGAAIGAAALKLDAGIGVVLRPAGFDVDVMAVDMEAVIGAFDSESGKLHVALAGIDDETVLRIVGERECGGSADRNATGHVNG